MTTVATDNRSGIYKLVFPSYKYYIGQAQNIRVRYKEHLRCLESGAHFNTKVLREYSESGKPDLHIVLYCDIHELNTQEPKYISLDDPNCLNILSGEPNQSRGENSPRALYSNETIVGVFKYLVDNPTVNRKNVASLFGVDVGTVHDVSAGRGRADLLKDAFPEEFAKLLANKAANTRGINTVTLTNGTTTVTLTSGQYSEFCRQNGVQSSNLSKVIKGSRRSTMGWSLVNK